MIFKISVVFCICFFLSCLNYMGMFFYNLSVFCILGVYFNRNFLLCLIKGCFIIVGFCVSRLSIGIVCVVLFMLCYVVECVLIKVFFKIL